MPVITPINLRNRLISLFPTKWLIVIWVMTGLCVSGFSQDFNHYQRLSPSGDIPTDFLLSPSEKYDRVVHHIEEKDKEKRLAQEEFYQESFYYINQLLLSGKVLFNDPISEYINQVGNYILRDHPELQKQIRFYVVKSPSVNAFATNNGLILVNMGLLAKMENEAQLAFVLCHEISHFIKKHPLDIYLNSRSLQGNRKGVLRRTSLEDILLEKSNYSKEKEQEADRDGLDLFLGTNYNLEVIESTFHILKYANTPFRDEKFEVSFFETSTLKFPSNYILQELKEVSDPFPEGEPGNSTHPAPDSRREILLKEIENIPNVGKENWIISKEAFLKNQKICRFETSYLYLYNQRYESAIYNSYLLMEDYGESFYLEKVIGQSLYGLAKYTCAGQFWDVHTGYDEIIGNSQQLYHLIEKMEDEELIVLAIIHNWNLHQKYPEDEEIRLMALDLMTELGRNYIDDISYFSTTLPTKSDSARENFSFIQYSLSNFLKKEFFSDLLKKKLAEGSQEKNFKNYEPHLRRKKKKSRRKRAIDGFNLGLNKVVFVDPFYQRVDDRKKSSVQFFQSEATEQTFINLLGSHAENIGLEYETLSTKQLNDNDLTTFDELTLLSEWINERSGYDDIDMVSINHLNMQALKKKYGTSYFVWSGVLSLTRPRTGKALVMSAGVIFLPLLPYSFYYAFSPNHDTLVYTMIYDIETGENLILYPKLIKMKDKPDVLNSVVYDLIYQIKNP